MVTESDILAAQTHEYRRHLRAQAIAESDDRPTFSHDDLTIVVTDGPKLVGSLVRVVVEVTHAPSGRRIPLDDANPFEFVNPPTKVPDGTTRTVTDPDGEVLTIPNFRYAPREAFRSILFDAVVGAVARSGFKP